MRMRRGMGRGRGRRKRRKRKRRRKRIVYTQYICNYIRSLLHTHACCQAQPKPQSKLGCAGSIPSFSVRQADRPTDRNSTF